MYIKQIKLQNGYKRFKDLTIDLGEDKFKIVALVGPNGSGKSSVFDGMLYLQAGYQHIGSSNAGDVKFHSMLNDPNYNSRRHENVQIIFDSNDFATTFNAKQASGKGKTIFSFRSPYRYSSNLQINTLSQISDIKENNIGAGASIYIDDKVSDNYQRLYSLIDRIYKKQGSSLTYEQAKETVLGELNDSLTNVLDIAISDHGDILDGRGTLFFKKIDQENEFSFNVLSSGEKEVVDILIDIFLKKEEFDDSIYIIDEPELHINTSIQRDLLNEIVKLIPGNSQIWIATHSIGFLNALKQDHQDSCIIWFDEDFANKSITLSPMKKSRENWKMIFETALEDLTGLMSPETIIYCEGRKEPSEDGSEQGLDAQVYNIIFESEFPDVLFVSSGGSTEPDMYSEIALKVLGKAFDSVELLLLKDKDINGSGAPTSDEERTHWISEEPKTRKMLVRKEIENYLFDLEILQKINPELNPDDFNKIITDIKDEDVKSKAGAIKELCGFKQMNKEDFKIKLAEMITTDTNVYKELKSVIFID